MRLTALCVCGTLLAFLSLSWTTADSGEGDLLGAKGFGPCTATLQIEGLCREGQDENTCPYLFSLPPLTVHLPKQLGELEKIMTDLQKLKDNVDQLRKISHLIPDVTQGMTVAANGLLTLSTEGVAAGISEHPHPDAEAGFRATRRASLLLEEFETKKKVFIILFFQFPFSAVTTVKRDCSDHLLRGETKSGVYQVTPDIRSKTFPVFCDMELGGGGWTLVQRRLDGSVSFNRTWAEYRSGFGELDGGEFWLGNNMIHLLTRDRDMVLRVELEDFDAVMEYAEYEQFKVASERLRYRLTVGGYSGTAGDALRFSKTYDHNNRPFTTPDRDNDRYPSGNCGAYYSSGWWFDACMAANLNGRYYVGTYTGVRDGIFWGTWHNISTEYYPTSDRRSFKTVRMMIRPKGFAP
ncbi:fibroleukin-like [Seriola lalandi dorsalis]|uniref:fibroleukin-like n=1 Tax=Seriola lalandi dorsalis TaxID=1841481 RepID=UPI000C6F8555|nr:fibroleukin-like [Seriola lalandi dorsalis]